jgi:hypothetical protein
MSERLLEGFGPFSTEKNPCVRLYGPGPDGAKCKTCSRLHARTYYPHTYYKCGLRKDTACAATDHRVRWRACAKYEDVDTSP